MNASCATSTVHRVNPPQVPGDAPGIGVIWSTEIDRIADRNLLVTKEG